MRFGIHLGPFWVSTSTRRKSRRPPAAPQSFQGIVRDENGREYRCAHKHRTLEAAQECARQENRRRERAAQAAEEQRIRDMQEELLRRYEADGEAQADALLQKMKEELAAVGFRCKACSSDGCQLVSGEFGAGMVVRCTSCGALHKARAEGAGA